MECFLYYNLFYLLRFYISVISFLLISTLLFHFCYVISCYFVYFCLHLLSNKILDHFSNSALLCKVFLINNNQVTQLSWCSHWKHRWNCYLLQLSFYKIVGFIPFLLSFSSIHSKIQKSISEKFSPWSQECFTMINRMIMLIGINPLILNTFHELFPNSQPFSP